MPTDAAATLTDLPRHRLTLESPSEIDRVEDYLQHHRVHHRVHKSPAKYLDEYNWFVVVGADQVGR